MILVAITGLSLFSQTPSSNYQPATVIGVTAHPNAPGDSEVFRYDVTLKVGNTVYVVLYSPPQGRGAVEYATGMELLVLVEGNSIRFTKLGTTAEMQVVSREALPIEKNIDWSKAPGQYFSMKMQNLTERLSLTDNQRARIKPIAEQEAGELGYLWKNPAISDKDKLKRLEQTVRLSDAKIKPILSAEQQEKLEQMRVRAEARAYCSPSEAKERKA